MDDKEPRISLIAAMSRNRVIGVDNRLPWRLPADLRHFQRTTLGKPVIMGRRTFESIAKKPLPGRRNIVLSRDGSLATLGVEVVASAEEALTLLDDATEVMIVGGSGVYEAFLPRAHRIYLTLVDEEFEGDAHFPEFDLGDWVETERIDHQPDERHAYPYSFLTLDRSAVSPRTSE